MELERPTALQRHTCEQQLPCIDLLQQHLEHCGIEESAFNMLYRMIEMTSAIGWEVHLVFQSKIPSGPSIANIRYYMDCILQGCSSLHNAMQEAAVMAKDAANTLPALNELPVDELETRLKQWRWKLKTLHSPTGNDARLFQLISDHYHDNAYGRLVELNLRKPTYGLEQLVERATAMQDALRALQVIAEQADRRVIALEEAVKKAASLAVYAAQQQSQSSSQQLLRAEIYQPQVNQGRAQLPTAFSKSFTAFEEEVAQKRHARAATVSTANYNVSIHSANHVQVEMRGSKASPTIGIRRKGTHVPRIFTGSFSQLENDIRRLQLHKIKTPDGLDGQTSIGHVKIRDFGATPAISPCGTPNTTTSLQRREAVVSRETEIQDRVIKGEVVSTRRPSTKERARTVNDATGLEAWLNEDSSASRSPDGSQAEVRRGSVRHREKTL